MSSLIREWAWSAKTRAKVLSFRFMSRQEVFTQIFETNYWSDPESRSGRGSRLDTTQDMRLALVDLVKAYQVRTMIDACIGDGNWLGQTPLELDTLWGYDIVEEAINQCVLSLTQTPFLAKNIKLATQDMVTGCYPKADMILCRDGLCHLSNRDAKAALVNFRASDSTFLLASTQPDIKTNRDIVTGDYRMMNLSIAPFNLGPPQSLIRDTGALEAHDPNLPVHLGLWWLE